MSATTSETQAIPYTPSSETLGAVLTFTERPPRPSAVSASVTFGWRAMLKFKHVPEQLIDVTAFPALITLMLPPRVDQRFGVEATSKSMGPRISGQRVRSPYASATCDLASGHR